MFRRILFGSGASAASAATAAVSGLKFDITKDTKSVEPTVFSLMQETEKRQGLVNLPPYNKREFALAAKTKDDQLAGGIFCYTNYNEVHIAMVAVNPKSAIRGTGTTLLKGAEMAARTKYDCNRMALETFDWQARPFYERYGYKVFGVQPNQPAGHEKYFMEKIWAPEESAQEPTCYKNATSELTLTEWDRTAAYDQLNIWLDEDTQNRKIPGVPPYDMTPYAMRVTDESGKLVACCMYETWWNELHLDKLVVSPEAQGKGVGSAVLKKIEEIAREKKLQQLVADAMSWQTHSFYEKRGFKVFATQKDVPKGHDHLRLLRVLE